MRARPIDDDNSVARGGVVQTQPLGTTEVARLAERSPVLDGRVGGGEAAQQPGEDDQAIDEQEEGGHSTLRPLAVLVTVATQLPVEDGREDEGNQRDGRATDQIQDLTKGGEGHGEEEHEEVKTRAKCHPTPAKVLGHTEQLLEVEVDRIHHDQLDGETVHEEAHLDDGDDPVGLERVDDVRLHLLPEHQVTQGGGGHVDAHEHGEADHHSLRELFLPLHVVLEVRECTRTTERKQNGAEGAGKVVEPVDVVNLALDAFLGEHHQRLGDDQHRADEGGEHRQVGQRPKVGRRSKPHEREEEGGGDGNPLAVGQGQEGRGEREEQVGRQQHEHDAGADAGDVHAYANQTTGRGREREKVRGINETQSDCNHGNQHLGNAIGKIT